MDRTSRDFVSHVRKHLSEWGFRLVFGRGKEVNCGMARCRGYFDEESKVVKVARGGKGWLSILVHEYCHYLQWLDGTSRSSTVVSDANGTASDWLEGKEFSARKVKRAFRVIRENERDCERRAVALIQKFGLPIDVEFYAKTANLYIYFWTTVEQKRKWNWSKRNMLSSRRLINIMPVHFRRRSYEKLPPEVEQILIEYD